MPTVCITHVSQNETATSTPSPSRKVSAPVSRGAEMPSETPVFILGRNRLADNVRRAGTGEEIVVFVCIR